MEFFEIAGEVRWECKKVLTERFPVHVCLWSFIRICFRNSLNIFFILNCHRYRYVLAYVSRGLGRGGGAVNGTWLEAHTGVTLLKLFHQYREIVVLLVIGSSSGDLHRAASGPRQQAPVSNT